MQYLGYCTRYCTVCNWFNPSPSIDLMLKNWTAHLDTSVIRVSSHFSLLFQFLLSLLHAYPYSKISETLSLFQPNMPQNLSLSHVSKKAISNAPITSPSKNECEPTVFQLPTQMWLDLVIKFMIFFFFMWFLCQWSSLCFIYSTKDYLFLSLHFLFIYKFE